MSNSRLAPSFVGLLALLCSFSTAQVTTSQYDNARTGANLNESSLTLANVNASSLAKSFRFP